MLSDDKLT